MWLSLIIVSFLYEVVFGCSSPLDGTSTSPARQKRGIAYNDALIANSLQKQCVACSWAYNWKSSPDGLDPAIEFVPMLHFITDTAELQSNIPQLVNRGLKNILGLNEPDYDKEANLTADIAANKHVEYLNPYSNIASIGSPAITSNLEDPHAGKGWLIDFLHACERIGCHIDFCAIHWYGPASLFKNFVAYIEGIHEVCSGKPIWITEFNCSGTPTEVQEFMKLSLKYLDETEYIQRYAWQLAQPGSLVDSTGHLNELGKLYTGITY